jgi:hypothetical protein
MSKAAHTNQPLLPTEKHRGGNSMSKEACLINGSQDGGDSYDPPYESQDMSNKLPRGRETEGLEEVSSSN